MSMSLLSAPEMKYYRFFATVHVSGQEQLRKESSVIFITCNINACFNVTDS